MEQSLFDLNKIVEKCSKEVEKEQQKKEQFVIENAELREKIKQFEHIYEDLQIKDPKEFKEDVEQTKEEIVLLRVEITSKQKALQTKEDKLDQQES